MKILSTQKINEKKIKNIEQISSELNKEKLKNKDLQQKMTQLKISLDNKIIELNNKRKIKFKFNF